MGVADATEWRWCAAPTLYPSTVLRVSGPSAPGRGWIPALGGRNDGGGGEGIASGLDQALRNGFLTTLTRPT